MTMSGANSFSHRVRWPMRARTELTFQVAIFMARWRSSWRRAAPLGKARTVGDTTRMIGRLAILTVLLASVAPALAQAQQVAPEPAFVENFAYPPATLEGLLERWWITRRLDKKAWPDRVAILSDP